MRRVAEFGLVVPYQALAALVILGIAIRISESLLLAVVPISPRYVPTIITPLWFLAVLVLTVYLVNIRRSQRSTLSRACLASAIAGA